VGDTDRFVQRLNDRFANPSGGGVSQQQDASIAVVKAEPKESAVVPVQAAGGEETHG
jgi:hypothetical protein